MHLANLGIKILHIQLFFKICNLYAFLCLKKKIMKLELLK